MSVYNYSEIEHPVARNYFIDAVKQMVTEHNDGVLLWHPVGEDYMTAILRYDVTKPKQIIRENTQMKKGEKKVVQTGQDGVLITYKAIGFVGGSYGYKEKT